MPYQSLPDLPSAIRDLPLHTQEIYMAAFNNAWKEYKEPQKRIKGGSHEEAAHRVAWAAVKKQYVKKGKQWVER